MFHSGLFFPAFLASEAKFLVRVFSPLALVFSLSFGLYFKGGVHVFSPVGLKGVFYFCHHQEALSPGLVVIPTDPIRLVQSLS